MDDIKTTDVSPPTTTQVYSCIEYGRYYAVDERREEYDRDCDMRESGVGLELDKVNTVVGKIGASPTYGTNG